MGKGYLICSLQKYHSPLNLNHLHPVETPGSESASIRPDRREIRPVLPHRKVCRMCYELSDYEAARHFRPQTLLRTPMCPASRAALPRVSGFYRLTAETEDKSPATARHPSCGGGPDVFGRPAAADGRARCAMGNRNGLSVLMERRYFR